MNRLKSLNLYGNQLKSIKQGIFTGMSRSRLEILDLSENELQDIADESFKELVRLQTLNLSANSLIQLSGKTFIGLQLVRRLYLCENDIYRLTEKTFEPLNSLELLDLVGNNLQTLSSQVFGGSGSRLKKLFLSRNSIASLPGDLFQLTPNIDYLSIAFNELTTLDPNLFSPLVNLKKLHLGHNLLEQIPPKAFDDINFVTELLIDHNKLTFLPESSHKDTLPKLVKASIEGNPWQCPCLDLILGFLSVRNIDYRRDQYFDGQKPVCVVTRVDFCVRNLTLVKREGIVDLFTGR